MLVYNQILSWSESRPLYLRDALRRLITSTITDEDIEELSLLVKTEFDDKTITNQPIPFDLTHIPSIIQSNEKKLRLLSLKNPKNICALHEIENLEFSKDGLTIIYGSNGSGKSSYSRVLKKLCWCRDSGLELKTNVFNDNNDQQQIELKLSLEDQEIDWIWYQGNESNPLLNSIYIFDNECSDVYINKENPAEYKPVGIDLLEKLIVVINRVQDKFKSEILQYNTTKFLLPNSLNTTPVANWYSSIEAHKSEDIDREIRFTKEDADRKDFLSRILSTPSSSADIQNLRALENRVNTYSNSILEILSYFNDEAINKIKTFKSKYETTTKAYMLASSELNNLNTIDGFGSNPWRILWQSAKDFAHSNNLTDGHNFPSNLSLDKCVLCQQELDEIAKARMVKFEQFVLNDISIQYKLLVSEYSQKKDFYSNISMPDCKDLNGIESYVSNLDEVINNFSQELSLAIQSFIVYLEEESEELSFSPLSIPFDIKPILEDIKNKVRDLTQSQQDRNRFLQEYNNLNAKECLFNNRAQILQYHQEFLHKKWIKYIIQQLSTSTISRKIGEIMTDGAINIQHDEFIAHLRYFNNDLANHVSISKTRTTQGQAFMKCGFNEVSEDMQAILSEGEQRIVAFSNFLAECTIGNRINTIIFDDPVTSLDIDYRELVANKLVELARNRQVIILTHDLAFMRLLIDNNSLQDSNNYKLIGIDKYNGKSGIVTDEIPYLAKNIQERIDSIRAILREHDHLQLSDARGRDIKLDSARKRFRMLLEKSVEDILSNKTYQRFSKNINLKKQNLSSYVITEESDINFILNLFGRYSITEHDGGISTIHQLPTRDHILNDIRDFDDWKESFKTRLKEYNAA